jgi:hypothetical protein
MDYYSECDANSQKCGFDSKMSSRQEKEKINGILNFFLFPISSDASKNTLEHFHALRFVE